VFVCETTRLEQFALVEFTSGMQETHSKFSICFNKGINSSSASWVENSTTVCIAKHLLKVAL
jgi:hypothetical protein